MEFTIDRSKWLRGDVFDKAEDSESSVLLDHAGRMCCLGFYLKACGVPKKKLLSQTQPDSLPTDDVPKKARWLLTKNGTNAPDTNDLITTNDIESTGAKERERRIRKKFRKHGVKVVFKGRTPKVPCSE